MAAGVSFRTIVLVVVAAAVAAGLGYWGYGAYKSRELRSSVTTILKDAGERMRDALSLQAEPHAADRSAPAKKIDDHVAALDQGMDKMKRLPLARDRALTDAADGYLITVREILRTQARMYRSYQMHTESLDALRDHMRVDDRRGAWVGAAVRANQRAERDFRDYRLANGAYATLLGSFAGEQKKIESAMPREALAAPDQITRAGERAIAIANDAAAEMEKTRKLVGPK